MEPTPKIELPLWVNIVLLAVVTAAMLYVCWRGYQGSRNR